MDIIGRLAYELSICSTFSDAILRRLSNNSVVYVNYSYELFIDLCRIHNVKQFTIDKIYYLYLKKLNLSNSLNVSIDSEIEDIFIDNKNLRPIAQTFKNSILNNSYIGAVSPIVLSYDRKLQLYHQCGILALGEPYNIFLFYEPYGTYNKWNLDYSNSILQMMELFNKIPGFETYKLDTYHKYFKLNIGIQTKIINYGTQHNKDFLKQYLNLKKAIVGSEYKNIAWDNEDDKTDSTHGLHTLMSKSKSFPDILKKASILFYKYSGKTCVSIFLIEVYNLINSLQKNDIDLHTLIHRWYLQFNTNPPETVMVKLELLLNYVYQKDEIQKLYEYVKNMHNSSYDICKFIKTLK